MNIPNRGAALIVAGRSGLLGGAAAATLSSWPERCYPNEQVATLSAGAGRAGRAGRGARAGARAGGRGADGSTGSRERGAGPSRRASARHLARTRSHAAGPGGTEEGERERGVWNVFPLWRTNNTGQRGGQAIRPFNRAGGGW